MMMSLLRRGQSEAHYVFDVDRRWTAGLAAVSLAALLISFQSTLLGMIETWYSSRTYSHCFLILPMFLYLVWLRRRRLAELDWEPTYRGVLAIGVFSLFWFVGNLGDVKIVEEFAFVGLLIALVWAFFGTGVVQTLRFPLVFLFFAVPFGVGLIPPLQDFTAWFTVHALNSTNIPAVLQNHTLSVPSGAWTVAETCSGIRYLFASLVLGTFFASLIYRSRRRQLWFLLASAVVPVMANGLRAYLVVFIAYMTNNRLAAGVDHIVYGGVFFVVVETTLLALGLRWRETSAHDWVAVSNSAASPSAPAKGRNRTKFANAYLVCPAVVVICMLTPLLVNHIWDQSKKTVWSEPSIMVGAPWRTSSSLDPTWASIVAGANRSCVQSYVSEQGRVELRYGFFTGRDVAIAHTYNLFSDPKFWSLVVHKSAAITIDGRMMSVDQTVFSGPASRTVWTWYWVNGEYTGSAARAKWLQAKALLLRRSTASVVITVGTDAATEDSPATNRVLEDFVQHTTLIQPTSSSRL
jgi:exosortase A